MTGGVSSIGEWAKRVFASYARGFAKRTAVWPAWPTLEIACALALGLAVLTGPFGTDAIDLPRRIAFWLVLLGANLIGWRLLINRVVRTPRDWPKAALIGTLLLNLPLPPEIPLVLRLVGVAGSTASAWSTWLEAAGLTALIYLAARVWGVSRKAAEPDPDAPAALLARWGIAPGQLAAVLAEDHYCRLVLDGGTERLVHGRFGDAVAALAALPGLQVHRGAWVSDAAVKSALREGRGWRLRLSDGRLVKVSASYREAARRRGLLNRASGSLAG